MPYSRPSNFDIAAISLFDGSAGYSLTADVRAAAVADGTDTPSAASFTRDASAITADEPAFDPTALAAAAADGAKNPNASTAPIKRERILFKTVFIYSSGRADYDVQGNSRPFAAVRRLHNISDFIISDFGTNVKHCRRTKAAP